MVGAGVVEIPAGRFRMGSVGFYPEEGPVREVEVVSRSTAGRLRSRGLPGLLRRQGIGRSPSGHRRPLTTRTPTPLLLVAGSAVFRPTPHPVPLYSAECVGQSDTTDDASSRRVFATVEEAVEAATTLRSGNTSQTSTRETP